jgi:hypothetical protein
MPVVQFIPAGKDAQAGMDAWRVGRNMLRRLLSDFPEGTCRAEQDWL